VVEALSPVTHHIFLWIRDVLIGIAFSDGEKYVDCYALFDIDE
jgi:hypothetical protein